MILEDNIIFLWFMEKPEDVSFKFDLLDEKATKLRKPYKGAFFMIFLNDSLIDFISHLQN